MRFLAPRFAGYQTLTSKRRVFYLSAKPIVLKLTGPLDSAQAGLAMKPVPAQASPMARSRAGRRRCDIGETILGEEPCYIDYARVAGKDENVGKNRVCPGKQAK